MPESVTRLPKIINAIRVRQMGGENDVRLYVGIVHFARTIYLCICVTDDGKNVIHVFEYLRFTFVLRTRT